MFFRSPDGSYANSEGWSQCLACNGNDGNGDAVINEDGTVETGTYALDGTSCGGNGKCEAGVGLVETEQVRGVSYAERLDGRHLKQWGPVRVTGVREAGGRQARAMELVDQFRRPGVRLEDPGVMDSGGFFG